MMTVYLYDESGAPIRRARGSDLGAQPDHVQLARVFPLTTGDVLRLSLLPDGSRETFVVQDADGATALARRVADPVRS